MTVIPLFFYIRGLENAGLATSGMIFFITPTSQFLLGYFYFNEPFSYEKFISFIFIWIAVFILSEFFRGQLAVMFCLILIYSLGLFQLEQRKVNIACVPSFKILLESQAFQR